MGEGGEVDRQTDIQREWREIEIGKFKFKGKLISRIDENVIKREMKMSERERKRDRNREGGREKDGDIDI